MFFSIHNNTGKSKNNDNGGLKELMKKLLGAFKFQNIYGKLIGISLIILIVPSLVVGVVSYNEARSQLNNLSDASLKNDVVLVNSAIALLNKQVQAGNMSLSYAQEQIKEMILGPKKSNGQRPINKSYNLGKNGYFFILNKKGVEVAHPSLEGKSIWNTKSTDGVMVGQQIIKKGEADGGFTTFMWPLPNSNNDAKKIVYSQMDPAGWGWVVVAGSYVSDYNAGANKILTYLLITVGIAVVIGVILIMIFARRISNPIKTIERQVNKVADGDLSVDSLNIKTKGEIGNLADGFNKMTENLKLMIGKISETAEHVASSAEQLSASSEESSKASEQVSSTIQEAAYGSLKQTESIEEGKQSIIEISKGVDHIAENSNVASSSAIDASTKAMDGNNTVQAVINQMNDINATVESLSQVVQDLGNHSGEIGQIVEAITSIANQTNLLALNAAIEAARAGESGRGFAVVADEVRKLAEESGQSAEKISTIISKIQNGTSKAVSATDQTTKQVSKGIDAVNVSGQLFSDIQKSIEEVSYQIQEVSAAAEQLSAGANQLNTSIEEVAKVSLNNSDSMQTVSATAEEQLAATEEISESAGALTQLAEDLQDIVKNFKL